MAELVIGLFAGIWLASRWGIDPAWAPTFAVAAAAASYAVSCAIYPYRKCPFCEGKQHVGDGKGNFRGRWFKCWWCGSRKLNRRLGARLMGRARSKEHL